MKRTPQNPNPSDPHHTKKSHEDRDRDRLPRRAYRNVAPYAAKIAEAITTGIIVREILENLPL